MLYCSCLCVLQSLDKQFPLESVKFSDFDSECLRGSLFGNRPLLRTHHPTPTFNLATSGATSIPIHRLSAQKHCCCKIVTSSDMYTSLLVIVRVLVLSWGKPNLQDWFSEDSGRPETADWRLSSSQETRMRLIETEKKWGRTLKGHEMFAAMGSL